MYAHTNVACIFWEISNRKQKTVQAHALHVGCMCLSLSACLIVVGHFAVAQVKMVDTVCIPSDAFSCVRGKGVMSDIC